MKKFLATILTLLYLYISTTSGAVVHIHYCMGKLVEWSLWHNNRQHCTTCGMEKTKDNHCCNDEFKAIKISKDHKVTAENNFTISQKLPATEMLPLFIGQLEQTCDSIGPKNNFSHDPPMIQKVAAFISNCVFRI